VTIPYRDWFIFIETKYLPLVTREPKGNPQQQGNWLSWSHLEKILEIAKGHFRTQAERKFVDDLIVCL
jgi:hypothetical protein